MRPVRALRAEIGKQIIGQTEVIEQILAELAIPILARDLGGSAGRRLTLDTVSGIVTIKVPGGAEYEL